MFNFKFSYQYILNKFKFKLTFRSTNYIINVKYIYVITYLNNLHNNINARQISK